MAVPVGAALVVLLASMLVVVVMLMVGMVLSAVTPVAVLAEMVVLAVMVRLLAVTVVAVAIKAEERGGRISPSRCPGKDGAERCLRRSLASTRLLCSCPELSLVGAAGFGREGVTICYCPVLFTFL